MAEQFVNPHSSYQAPAKDTMGGFSTPFSKGFWTNDKGNFDPSKVLTGQVAMDDLNKMFAPVYNTYQATAYDPNAANFTLGDAWSQQYGSAAQSVAGRQGPQMAMGPQDEMRRAQLGVLGHLGQRAFGAAPSAAERQMDLGLNRAINAAQSQAAGATSSNRALAQRQAMDTAAGLGQQVIAEKGALRAQEQAQAEQALTGALSGVRGQDVGVASTQLQADLQQRQMNDQMTQFYQQMGYDRDQAQLMANIEMEKMRQEEQARVDQMMADIAKQNAQAEKESQGGILGAAGEFFGGLTKFSDERLKENIVPASADIDDFMKSLDAVSYDYIGREDLPKGRHYGIMAQDLEKSKVGKTLVINTPKGKMVDYGRGYGAVLASLRRLEERLSGVEAKAGA